jgi:hypothetical protein
MQIVQNGFISHLNSRPADQRFATFVSLCELESRALICVFQVGLTKQDPQSTLGMCRSDDGGLTWQPIAVDFATDFDRVPGSFAGAEMVEVRPGLVMLCTTWFNRSDPSLPLFDSSSLGILPTKQLCTFSVDQGNSWSKWEEICVGELKACALTGPLLRWSDGTIGLPFESYKEQGDPRPAHHAAWLLTSDDGGRRFSELRLVARHPQGHVYYWDQRLCALPAPGEYIAMFWTHDLKAQKDLNVHMRRGSIHQANEATSSIRATNIRGQIAAPAVLQDGRWLAFVVDRAGPSTIRLWVSHDEGRSWPEQDAFCIYRHDELAVLSQGQDNIDYRQYWDDMLKWTFGHPAIRTLRNGKVLLAFYAGSPEGTSVHWSMLDPNKRKIDKGTTMERSDSLTDGSSTWSPISSGPRQGARFDRK